MKGLDKMVEQLVKEIADLRKQLSKLEKQLKDIQRRCIHHFREGETYRICQKCQFVESYHY